MRIGFRNQRINYFLEGGAMPAPDQGGAPDLGGAPMPPEGGPQGAPQGPELGGDPMEMLMQLAQMAMQALQGQDANMAMQVCEGLVQFVQMVQGGGQGGPEGAPEEQGAPQEPLEEPVYRRGGLLVGKIKKKLVGGSVNAKDKPNLGKYSNRNPDQLKKDNYPGNQKNFLDMNNPKPDKLNPQHIKSSACGGRMKRNKC